MFCPKCGSEVADGSAFCGKCGAQFGAPAGGAAGGAQGTGAAGRAAGVPAAKKGGAKVGIIIAVVVVVLVVAVGFATNWFGLAGVQPKEAVEVSAASQGAAEQGDANAGGEAQGDGSDAAGDAAAYDEKFQGDWVFFGGTINDQEIDRETLDAMKQQGVGAYLQLKGDGSAVMNETGTEEYGVWEAQDASTVSVILQKGTVNLSLEGDELVWQMDDNSLRFERGEIPAGA